MASALISTIFVLLLVVVLPRGGERGGGGRQQAEGHFEITVVELPLVLVMVHPRSAAVSFFTYLYV